MTATLATTLPRGGMIISTDTTYESAPFEGARRTFADDTLSNGTLIVNSGTPLEAIAVRNVSGGTLYPKRLCKWQTGKRGTRVDGASAIAGSVGLTTGDNVAGVVDSRIPASGVPTNYVFWMFVKGPHLCTTNGAADVTNDFDAADVLVCAATADDTTGASTANNTMNGCIELYIDATTTGAANIQVNGVHQIIGRAMSTGITTANTGTDCLVYLDLKGL